MPFDLRRIFAVTCLLLVWPSAALAGDFGAREPFPTDLLTEADPTQLTGLRVALPAESCRSHPSDCADVAVLNTLDGFNVQPRLSIPFSGPIDLSSVSSDTIFLVDASGRRIGINQVVWEPARNTLHAESDELLRQGTRYLLVVTDGVRPAGGGDDDDDPRADGDSDDDGEGSARVRAYREDLRAALRWSGVNPRHILAASLFTTQSVTAISEKIRRQIDESTPAPATFGIGPLGARAVFSAAAVRGLMFQRQVGTAPSFSTTSQAAAVPVFPGAIGTIAFGRFVSPDYETAERVIPAYGTRTGVPVPLRTNDVYFNLYLPSGEKPAGGWPVAIFGHGFGDSKQGAPTAVASTLAASGVATIAINVVGHGGGPLGTLIVLGAGAPSMTIPNGGRGIDQDGNGTIDSTEGVNAAPPADFFLGSRDGLRQTVIDLMQLVRQIEVGVDVDGDEAADLDPARISYAGQSFGGIYGTQLLALDPGVGEGVLNVPGGSIPEIARLSPSFRSLVGLALLARAPSLYNAAPDPTLQNFVENIPLRDQPILVDTAFGASAIQEYIDRAEWAQNAANPVAYARHLRAEPLEGVGEKAVIVQFAKGDRTVPNPTTTALLRAGGLADRATYFRNDLALALVPGYTTLNPHTFLTNLLGPGAPFAVAAQRQLAIFLASAGATTIDPDGPGPFFEAPIAGPLPETLNFAP